MGEIMRWRVARSAQRRIPSTVSTVDLREGGTYDISVATQTRLQNLQNGGRDPTYSAYIQLLVSVASIEQYLTASAGAPAPGRVPRVLAHAAVPMRARALPAAPGPSVVTAPVSQVFAALLQLDRWLAARSDQPALADLSAQVDTLSLAAAVGTATWTAVHVLLNELFYAALILSAYSNSSGTPLQITQTLGWLCRLILVTGVVDLLQSAPPPLQGPQDIYSALRWRTPVLPDSIDATLRTIRLRNNAVLVRKPGFADLYITREEWDHYEAAEIASIENILAKETKSHVHVLVNRTQTSTTTDTSTTTVKEQDTTTTDLSQLQQQSSSDVSIAAHVDGQVDVSGQYGPTQVSTHLGGSLDYSNAQSTSKSITQSHETVARAVTKVEKNTRQIRTVSTMTQSVDREEHKFDNQSALPVVGIYRWVDQIQNIELDRYPHRFLLEFELPEPGAWTRWLHLNDATRAMINPLPPPLTVTGLPGAAPLLPTYLADSTDPRLVDYREFVARYNVQGVSPPNAPTKVVAVNLSVPQSGTDPSAASVYHVMSDYTLAVPDGYVATGWTANAISMFAEDPTVGGYVGPSESTIEVVVGGAPPQSIPMHNGIGTPTANFAGAISDGNIPVGVVAQLSSALEINIAVTCTATPASVQQWQTDTYAQISSAYTALLQAYNNEKAGLSVQTTNPAAGGSPTQNAQTVKYEIKRQVIEMITGVSFQGFDAINWDATGGHAPTTSLNAAAQIAPQIQFMEQAFEWETLSYICYPYYWGYSTRWPDLARLAGNDPDYLSFLQAGSARVVLAARPGFEDQVNFYINYGVLWGGGPMPAPGDENYLSIADEIKDQQQRPLDMTVVDAWQVRLPTTLIWLENNDGLPQNPSPTILVLTKVFPSSGAVGANITLVGSNFQATQGNSVVLFNGAPAAPTSWSGNSISVPVPANASSGDIVVSVNGLVSNGVSFEVTAAPANPAALLAPRAAVRPAPPAKRAGRRKPARGGRHG